MALENTLQILILGGGIFLGAAMLDAALAEGHTVTVFKRGRARGAWPEGVEVLTGDRGTDLASLGRRRWDAVIDTCGYVPTDVLASAEALRASGCYLFVSSVSAYASTRLAPPNLWIAETDPLASNDGIARDDRDMAHYGPQKAACEAEVTRVFGERALIVRPGLIVGPGDRTGRFSHWPWRAAAGGEMLVPDVPGTEPLQFIDVRDLGAWMLHLLEHGARGTYNATGPAGAAPLGWAALVDTCRAEAVARGLAPATVVRVGEAFLQQHAVQPWSELPLWLPSTEPDYAGFMRVSLARTEAAGLRTRPLRETVAAVLDEGLPAADDKRRAGKLTREREAQLLAAWSARTV
jgi:2'-hydroxyisoflavone reductase